MIKERKIKNKGFSNNNNSKTKDIIATILIILVGISFFVTGDKSTNTNEIKNDYYEAINKEIIENNELEEDEMYWSLLFTELQDDIDEKVDNIVKDIVSKKGTYEKGSKEEKICLLYDSVMNKKDDLTLLDTYIKSIDNSNSINSLMSNVSKINDELSLNLLFSVGLENDFENNEETMLVVSPFVFDYGNIYSDYYTNPLYSSYISMYIKYDREILKLYGYSDDEAKEVVRNISKFYSKLAKESKTMEEISDVKKIYNRIERTELNKLYSNVNLDLFLNKYSKDYKICIVDEKQAKMFNEMLNNDNLETLKGITKLQLLQNVASYTDTRYFDLLKKMDAELTGTEVSNDTIEDYAIDLITTYFDSEITQAYVALYDKKEVINDFKNIINDIITEYKVKINENTWLMEETKQKAILKLDNMKINVGYPDEWENYSEAYVLTDNLLNNIINMNKVLVKYNEDVVKNNESIWYMSPLMVNAYYNAQENSINFPIAILECKIDEDENSYYTKLGSLGMIIAHEITHAFDDAGALFDEKGNLNNWWQESDLEKFEELQDRVIAYYDKYLIEGKKVNGKQTVGENIADLGAVSCITNIAKKKSATEDELKNMYEAYAKIWASESTKEYLNLLISMDSHSPDKVRVNAVLSSIDEFYELYDINENDEMYKAKEDRIKVW